MTWHERCFQSSFRRMFISFTIQEISPTIFGSFCFFLPTSFLHENFKKSHSSIYEIVFYKIQN